MVCGRLHDGGALHAQAGLDRHHASEDEGFALRNLRACASHAAHARRREDVQMLAQLARIVEREPDESEVLNQRKYASAHCQRVRDEPERSRGGG